MLVRDRWEAERLQRALSERGLEVRFVDGDSTGGTGKPLVMTMHRSKGMEFARVVLFGMSAGAVPSHSHLDRLPEADRQDALLRERSLVYVAATRARDHLVVTWSGAASDLFPAT